MGPGVGGVWWVDEVGWVPQWCWVGPERGQVSVVAGCGWELVSVLVLVLWIGLGAVLWVPLEPASQLRCLQAGPPPVWVGRVGEDWMKKK